jgi:hypothetical protein
MNYAIFGVMAGIALLTTTIVSVLPVQRALAVCTSDPLLNHKFACAKDPRIGGGAFAFAPLPFSSATANNLFNGGVGHACALRASPHPPVLVCVP